MRMQVSSLERISTCNLSLGLALCTVYAGAQSGWAHVGPKWAQARNLGPQKNKKNQKFSKSKSVLPKMSARSGLVGKNPPGPIWGHLGPFFAWAGKIEKITKFCLFSLVGPWALFTWFGALLLARAAAWRCVHKHHCLQTQSYPSNKEHERLHGGLGLQYSTIRKSLHSSTHTHTHTSRQCLYEMSKV